MRSYDDAAARLFGEAVFEHDRSTFRVLITPDLAAKLLAANPASNRRVHPTTAQKYLAMMKAGQFVTTHQGIAINEDGELMDGQNRLKAIQMFGEAVECRVTIGEPRDNFKALDRGLTRQAQQFIKLPSPTSVQAAATLLGGWTGRTDSISIAVDGRPLYQSLARTMEIVEEWEEEFKRFTLVTARIYKVCRISHTAHLAVVCMASRTAYADSLDSWLAGLESGAGLTATDPRLLLRNRFQRDYRALSTNLRVVGAALIIKAWNAYAQGRPLGVLKHASDEVFPKVIGWEKGSPLAEDERTTE